MTDLFSAIPPRPDTRDVGKGNAMFLADLAQVVAGKSTLATVRANIAARKYAHLNKPWAAENVAFWGLA